jgi:hypothetical protein
MEPAKYFNNVILGQYVLTGAPVKVFVNGSYLTITDVDDIEDPMFGFGMDQNGAMVPFDYRTLDHILVSNNNITVDTYNKAMSGDNEASSDEKDSKEEPEKEDKKEEEGESKNPFESKQNMKLKPMIEKAVSKAQQKLFGAALSVKRGDTDTKEVSKDVATLAKSLSDKELAKFAGTKHKGLPEKKKEETNEDLGSAQQKLQKAKEERAKASAKEAEAAAAVAKEEEKMAKMSEDIGDTNTISEPYMFQVGDIVNNVNPQCNHFGSMGIVQKLITLPNEMGTLVKYMVTNHGGTYTPGMMLTKTMDQLAPVGPSVPDDMDYTYDDEDYDSGDYDDWDIVSGDDYDDYDDDDYDDEDED